MALLCPHCDKEFSYDFEEKMHHEAKNCQLPLKSFFSTECCAKQIAIWREIGIHLYNDGSEEGKGIVF